MATDTQFDAALDLLRRLPPLSLPTHLENLCTIAPHLTEDLLSSVDQPLKIKRCSKSGRDYLICDYNRDGDSYRSPWSGEFEPPVDDDGATYPSERVRKMEIEANAAFDVYRDLYYAGTGTNTGGGSGGGGASVGSVYFWDLDDGFAGVVLLKKTMNGGGAGKQQNSNTAGWDSIHVFEVAESATARRTAHYKLTSTVILHLGRAGDEALGDMSLSGNMTRQIEADVAVEDDRGHVVNVGRLVEDMEGKMRNLLQEVYFGKAKDVVGDLRSIPTLSDTNREKAAHRDVISSMSGK